MNSVPNSPAWIDAPSFKLRWHCPYAAAAQSARQSAPNTAGVAWTQWGGPHRNFTTEASGIKDTWPSAGPRVVWKRKLGEGCSSPAVEGGVLYSMHGRRGEEVVFAANADTGQTLWEHATPRSRWAMVRTPRR
jgi:hypothetical protein